MAQYATAANLATFLDLTFDAGDTTRANLILESVSDEIAGFCTRVDFEQTEDDVVSLQGTWDSVLLLPGGPVDSVSAVSVDGTTLNSNDYEVHPHKLIRIRPGQDAFADVYSNGLFWGGHRRRVSVTYTHGFSSVPSMVEKITLRAAARVWSNPEQRRSVSLETGHRADFERMAGVYLTAGDMAQLVRAGYRWTAENAR